MGRQLICVVAASFMIGSAAGQQPASEPSESVDKRVFGVLPNYRTADGSRPFQPISAKQKFTIASKDSFDWPLYLTSGAFAGLYHLEDQNPSFGQGVKGYARRYAGAYGDQAIGNMMTEAIFPSLLREDPRYFRRGEGGKWSRMGYAMSRIFVTRTDAGRSRLNFSELVGNSATVAISNAYYPDTRTVSDNTQKLAVQLATDMFSNVLKEFWPDIKRKLARKQRREQ